jgi:hypothetical protein
MRSGKSPGAAASRSPVWKTSKSATQARMQIRIRLICKTDCGMPEL